MSENIVGQAHTEAVPKFSTLRIFIITVLGKFMLSILCFMASLGTAEWGLEFLGMDSLSLSYATFPIALGVMILAGVCMSHGIITDSIVMLMFAVSQTISTITYFSLDSDANEFINLFFVIGFFMATYIYHVRNQVSKYPVSILAVTMVLTALLGYHGILGTIGYYAAGILFFFQATYSLYIYYVHGTINTMLLGHVTDDRETYSHTLVGTAGVLSFSILSMVLCYYVLDGSHSAPFYVMKLILALVVMMFAFYAISHGVFGEGFLMLGISINITLFSFMHLFHLHATVLLSLLTSLLYLPLVYRFIKEGDKLLAMTSLLLFLIFFLEGLTDYAQYIEVLVLVLKVISCVLAMCAWVEAEAGRKLLSFIHIHHHHEVDETMDHRLFGTVNTYVTLGFLQVWTGSIVLAMSAGITDHIVDEFYIVIILSLISLLFVGNMFRNNMVSEGILLFVMNIYILSSAILMVTEGSVPRVGYMMFVVAAIISFVVFCIRRNVNMAVTALALIVSYTMGSFDGTSSGTISGIMYVLAGSLLVFRSMLGVLFGKAGYKYLFAHDDRMDRGDTDSVALVPFSLFLVSMMCFLITLSDVNTGFNVVGLLISVISLYLGIVCVSRGDIMYFLLVLMVSMFTFTICATNLMGGSLLLTSLAPLVVLGLIISPVYYRIGWKVVGVSCMVSSILMAIGALFDVTMVLNIGFNILGIVLMLYALNLWVSHDIGVKPLGFLTMKLRGISDE